MEPIGSRDVPVQPAQAALLFIDVQNYTTHRDGGEFRHLDDAGRQRYAYYFDRLERLALPNMRKLQAGCRQAGLEVLYAVIESLTQDGRDRSLDYKISGVGVPRGSWDARVADAIAPGPDEIVLSKTSSSVFISTNIDYVLRNLGIRQLILCGLISDQCVESAVRDACDLGYLVTLVPDACATLSPERQEASVKAIAGYCRQRATAEFLAELKGETA